jgi:hypothetical protein
LFGIAPVVVAYPPVVLEMTNPPAVPPFALTHAAPIVVTIAFGDVDDDGVVLSATITAP